MNKQDYEEKKADDKAYKDRKRPRKVLRRGKDGDYE